jgi:hypothetical protein
MDLRIGISMLKIVYIENFIQRASYSMLKILFSLWNFPCSEKYHEIFGVDI